MPLEKPIPRNCISTPDFYLCPVDDFSLFTGFTCGNDDLDDFLHNDAAKHARELIAKTYVMHARKGETLSPPIAFVSLMNDALPVEARFKKTMPNRCRYDTYPAVKIGRLGVRCEIQRSGVGRSLLNLLKVFFLTDNRTGCRFVTVDAYNDTPTTSFYQSNGFDFLVEDDSDSDTRAMYFDLRRFKVGSTEK